MPVLYSFQPRRYSGATENTQWVILSMRLQQLPAERCDDIQSNNDLLTREDICL